MIFSLLNAQSTTPVNPDRGMGMNVVILVIAIIFSGIVMYLINIDRKVSKLEKEVNSH